MMGSREEIINKIEKIEKAIEGYEKVIREDSTVYDEPTDMQLMLRMAIENVTRLNIELEKMEEEI